MQSRLTAELSDAASAAFEQVAFMVPTPAGRVAEPGGLDGVAVDFKGPLCGRMVLAVSHHLLPALAANMMGEEQVAAERHGDALGEMANIICGAFLPAVGGTNGVYAITPPAHADLAAERARGDAAAALDLAVEDGWAEVLVFFD
jgi:chemotaxis protein CheY-P-specific phosphatase CheC